MNNTGSAFLQVSEISTKEERYEPFGWYREMRSKTPVRYDEARGVWDVFRYEDVKFVLENKDVFSSSRSQSSQKSPIEQSLISIDPPKHTAMRSLVNKAFTPRAMKDWEPRIERIVRELLDDIQPGKETDVVAALSSPLPVLVIAELMGIPSHDHAKFKEWSDWVVAGPKDNSAEELQKLAENQMRTYRELYEYFAKTISFKKTEPADDIISVLVRSEIDGEKLTDEEIIGFCILLLVAGNETTTNLISNTLYSFIEYPDEYKKVKKDPDLYLKSAIEEGLRYRSPVQSMSRVAKEDVEISGTFISKGSFVFAWMGSANRDEDVFEHAHLFIADRKPNPHLAFGKGIHFCLGSPLARMEAEIVLREWIKKFPDFGLSSDFELNPIESTFVYGLKELKVKTS
ncbi:cytochrome P450 [Bacillus sp. FJAT-42376]|uniref:cytochrome P450 n=1 Tax=Bacillus sp. FJAT-42376 TaxID=2014076 RepID=UPI000F510CA4|nr:cytochrome P450 [Bacillus sp. FJAT-42376]AZB42473.1 cytochrome P450 [Bacillus sp. FJAT-42376]